MIPIGNKRMRSLSEESTGESYDIFRSKFVEGALGERSAFNYLMSRKKEMLTEQRHLIETKSSILRDKVIGAEAIRYGVMIDAIRNLRLQKDLSLDVELEDLSAKRIKDFIVDKDPVMRRTGCQYVTAEYKKELDLVKKVDRALALQEEEKLNQATIVCSNIIANTNQDLKELNKLAFSFLNGYVEPKSVPAYPIDTWESLEKEGEPVERGSNFRRLFLKRKSR